MPDLRHELCASRIEAQYREQLGDTLGRRGHESDRVEARVVRDGTDALRDERERATSGFPVGARESEYVLYGLDCVLTAEAGTTVSLASSSDKDWMVGSGVGTNS